MLLPGRHANTSDYRYGFQGQEMDDEIKGEGNSLNYTFRMHDPRVGRFFAVDPLFKEYPWNSSYTFSENKVIRYVELEGLEVGDPFYWLAVENSVKNPDGVGAHYLGFGNGVGLSLKSTWDFFTSDAYKSETWKNAGNAFIFFAARNPVTSLEIDKQFGTNSFETGSQVIQAFDEGADKLINGNGFERGQIIGQFTTDVGLGIIGDKGIGKIKYLKRFNLSKKFDIATDFIDYSKKVYTQTFKEGDVIYQYRIPGTDKGSYYVRSLDITPEQVGVDPSDYTEVFKVTLDKDMKALISTHKKNTPYWRNPDKTLDGGGEQIFSKDLKDNATFEKLE